MRWLVLVVTLALGAGTAAADKADAMFKKGKQLLAKKQYAEACPTFEKVDQIDPGIGAKLNVARCYQEWGKLGRAYKWYADAEQMAKDTSDDRAAKIRKLMDDLDSDVPRLMIRASDGADVAAAGITVDGAKLPAAQLGVEQRIDPGPHEISYSVNGERKVKTVAIERGGATEITIELPKASGQVGGKGKGKGKDKGKGGDGDDDDTAEVGKAGAAGPSPGRARRIAAFALMAAGGVGVGVSGYLAFDARDTYRGALDTHCMGQKDMCDPEGLQITSDARGRANLATVFAIVGIAAAGGGLALYLTAPRSGQPESLSRSALYVAPAIGDGGGLVVIGGRY